MRIFLSFAAPDQTLAQHFKAVLAQLSGVTDVFYAPEKLRAGTFWLPQLSDAITQSDAFVMLVGKQLGEWQKLEYYEAVRKHLEGLKGHTAQYPVLPILMTADPPTLPFLRNIQWIAATDLTKKVAESVLAALAGRSPQPQELWKLINPYKGLLSLGEEDAEFFWARRRDRPLR